MKVIVNKIIKSFLKITAIIVIVVPWTCFSCFTLSILLSSEEKNENSVEFSNYIIIKLALNTKNITAYV